MQSSQIITLVLLLGAMYFLLIRPQQQRQRQHRETVSSLRPGQRVVTIGGLIAEIVEIRGDRLLLEVADGSTMEYMKEAISRVLPDDAMRASEDLADEDAEEMPAEDEPTDEIDAEGTDAE